VGITGSFTGIGVSPQVASAVATTLSRVRVTFNEPMTDDAALNDPGSYTIDEDMGSAARTVDAVTPEAVAEPTYVDLDLDGECTVGTNNYAVTVDTAVVDAAGNALDAAHDSADFSPARPPGEPQVASAESLNPRRVRVTFNEPMTDDATLRDPDSYTIDEDVGSDARTVEGVLVEPATYPSYVDLDLDGDLSLGTDNYTVTVDLAVEDAGGTSLDPAHASADFSGLRAAGALDHCEAAKARVLAQFVGKEKYEDWLCTLTTGYQKLEQAIQDVGAFDDLETAYGATLDQLGEILGQAREDHDETEYRVFLRAKALAVQCRGQPDAMLEILTVLVNGHEPDAVEYEPAYPAVAIFRCEVPEGRVFLGRQIAEVLRSVKPNGVRMILEYHETGATLFGWAGQAGVAGWGTGVWAHAVTGS
jgi:hypothetical protein